MIINYSFSVAFLVDDFRVERLTGRWVNDVMRVGRTGELVSGLVKWFHWNVTGGIWSSPVNGAVLIGHLKSPILKVANTGLRVQESHLFIDSQFANDLEFKIIQDIRVNDGVSQMRPSSLTRPRWVNNSHCLAGRSWLPERIHTVYYEAHMNTDTMNTEFTMNTPIARSLWNLMPFSSELVLWLNMIILWAPKRRATCKQSIGSSVESFLKKNCRSKSVEVTVEVALEENTVEETLEVTVEENCQRSSLKELLSKQSRKTHKPSVRFQESFLKLSNFLLEIISFSPRKRPAASGAWRT